jgi:hypothetical protein
MSEQAQRVENKNHPRVDTRALLQQRDYGGGHGLLRR